MKLIVTTPTSVVAEIPDLASLRAEDDSGAFGILPGHADFLTALAVSVVSWRHENGKAGHCAVRGGILTVSGGKVVAIASREAVLGEDLARLEAEVLAYFRAADDSEGSARTAAARLHAAALRYICSYLRPGRPWHGGSVPHGPAHNDDADG